MDCICSLMEVIVCICLRSCFNSISPGCFSPLSFLYALSCGRCFIGISVTQAAIFNLCITVNTEGVNIHNDVSFEKASRIYSSFLSLM